MAQKISHITEGHSINHPPYFNGEDYSYQKDRMKLFIEATSQNMWEIIKNEDYVLTSEHLILNVVTDPDCNIPNFCLS